MIDISHLIEPEDLPLCPLCDQPIMSYEESVTVMAAGAKAMAHQDCIDAEVSGDE